MFHRTAASLTLLTAFVGATGPTNDGFELVLFNHTTHNFPEAVCLDGSPAGMYYYSGSDTSTWIIELEGGGWCTSYEDCVGRSRTAIGSSLSWPAQGCPSMDGGSNGMLSSNCTLNPVLCTASKVHVNYCDGASFAGYQPDPVSVNGTDTQLWFRGARIFDAAVETALALGMANATNIILKGCSAGGLATYLHCDGFAAAMRQRGVTARVVCAPDAGFFRDHPTYAGTQLYTPQMQWVFAAQGVGSSGGQADADCVAHYGPLGQAWKCFMAEYTLPFIITPLHITQDLVDSWQLTNILALPCHPYIPGNCTAAQMAAAQAYRTSMLTALAPALGNARNAGFYSSCVQHCHQNIDAVYSSEVVANQTPQQTFLSWWTGAGNASAVVVDGPYGGNMFCHGVPYRERQSAGRCCG